MPTVALNDIDHVALKKKWNSFGKLTAQIYMTVKHNNANIVFPPLYIHIAKVAMPHTISEAEKFNIHYSSPNEIKSIADMLR